MDGSLCATGSVDASIKILDVDRMLAKSQIESMASGNKPVDPGSHPVIRTLYDHVEVRIKKKVKFPQFFSKIFYFLGSHLFEISSSRNIIGFWSKRLYSKNIRL